MLRTHIIHIVHLPDGQKFAPDVAFGGDGPTTPLPMVDNKPPPMIQNLGAQQVRIVHDIMSKQRLHTAKILRLSEDLPVVVEIVDSQDKIDALLLAIEPMMGRGLVTLETVQVVRYGDEPPARSST